MNRNDIVDLLQYNAWANERILACSEHLTPAQLKAPANFDHK
jgi:hypothetical protein